MIRFAHPLVLILLLGLPLLFLSARRGRRGILPRLLTAFLVILALAGPQVGRQQLEENIYFLVDQSPSVIATTTSQEIKDQLDAIVSANPGRHFGVITFAKRAVITDPIDALLPTLAVESALGTGTDIAAAVDLALATLPSGSTSQIVLASDGRLTDGLTEAISAAQQAGLPISTLPIGGIAEEDVSLLRLDLPGEVEINRPFVIEIAVAAARAGNGVIALYRDGELIASSQ